MGRAAGQPAQTREEGRAWRPPSVMWDTVQTPPTSPTNVCWTSDKIYKDQQHVKSEKKDIAVGRANLKADRKK